MPERFSTEYFICEHCGKKFDTMDKALDCEDLHNVVYIPIQRSDLERLNSFISTGNPAYLTATLTKTLRKYSRLYGV